MQRTPCITVKGIHVQLVGVLIIYILSSAIAAANPGLAPCFMEPKPDDFKAEWIGPGVDLHSDAVGGVFFVRKVFATEHPESFSRVYVSADSQYRLFVNGIEVFRGPARFDPMHQVYDTLDLSAWIKPGENVVAAMVMYWGLETNEIPYFQCSMKPAFLLDSPELKTGASWKTLVSAAHQGAGRACTRGGGAAFWYEKVDGREFPVGYETADFDAKAWKPADVIADAEKWGAPTDTSSPWKLYPRRIPAPEIHDAESVSVVQAGLVDGPQKAPPFRFDVKPSAETAASPYTFPADGKTHYLVVDAGRLVNGFVSVDLAGKAGDAVEIMYAEAPEMDGDKARRDVLADRRVEGSNDIYILRDGRQIYEPMLHRTFRFIRIAVRAESPVTLNSLTYRWTGYAFPERGAFQCSDEKLNKIWQVGWYTQRMCAFDTFQDCPYYERMQYGGDTRIQGLISLYASGDTLLLANAIRQLQASALPEGLIQSRYPNHVFQVIPGYSLCWIQMLDDYYRHTGDLELVRESAHTVEAILRFYERHKTDKGFVSNLPYWNFYDWTYENNGVPDANREDCTLSTMHYKGALDIAANLFDALSDPLMAERCRRESVLVAEKINAQAWDESTGLYRDGITTQTFSQHVNVFAVLFGLADAPRRARIAEKLFTDKSLRGTTFYFAHYLHEAAEQLGLQPYIIKDMDRWQSMLDKGATTWWETPEAPRSECHAWSATPTYRFMEMVLGVKPTAPGFKEVLIQPWTGDLAWAEGKVPTPRGDIHVRWDKGSKFQMTVTLPEGMAGAAVLPDGSRETLKSGENHLQQ